MENLAFDVLVIGAGAAGLLAARELATAGRSVAVIEAKDRMGGRIYTTKDGKQVTELGAEFVHGDLPLTKEILAEARAGLTTVSGSLWQFKDGRLQRQEDFVEDYSDLEKKCKALKEDKSVLQFLNEDLHGASYQELRYSLKNYVEGYDAADTSKASARAMCTDLTKEDEDQYRVVGGYHVLVAYLEKECRKKGVQFFLSQPVSQIHWKKGQAVAVTETASYQCAKVLLTVSLGVLQQDAITFFPALPSVKKAVHSLGFGHVVKIVMRFQQAFWQKKSVDKEENLSRMGFLFSREAIPTWWTHFPDKEPVLTGWLGGPSAQALQFLSNEDVTKKALLSLSAIFHQDVAYLQQLLLTTSHYNWSADPHFYGAYSYAVLNGEEAITSLKQPIEQTLFFAGEALHQGPEVGTVEAALQSGKEAAGRMLRDFSL